MINGLYFIDALCQLGNPCIKRPGAFYKPGQLLIEMDRVGVDAALVHHVAAREVAPQIGNQLLLQTVQNSSRLLPAWVLLPPVTDELTEPENLAAQLREARIAATLLFPGDGSNSTHSYRLTPRQFAPVYEALQQALVPVILHAGTGGIAPHELEAFLQAFPSLPVILARYPATRMREILPLLRDFPSLHLEASLLQVHGGLEWICERFGAERLVFGSNLPVSSLGAAVAPIVYADIGDEAKRLIAGGNLLRLIGRAQRTNPTLATEPKTTCSSEVRPIPPCPTPNRPAASIPYGIIDIHGHVGPWAPAWIAKYDAASIVESMDRLNINLLCATSAWSLSGDNREGNDYLAEAIKPHLGRILPYATANPHDPNPAAELTRCFDTLGMRLIKVHPAFHRVPLNSPAYEPVWRFAHDRQTLVLVHTVGDAADSRAAIQIAESHPGLRLILAHAANSFEHAVNYLQAAAHCSNIYIEITFSSCLDGILEYLMEQAPSQVLFGTDIAWRAPETQVGWALYARMDEKARRMLLRDNALRLLSEVGALPDSMAHTNAATRAR